MQDDTIVEPVKVGGHRLPVFDMAAKALGFTFRHFYAPLVLGVVAWVAAFALGAGTVLLDNPFETGELLVFTLPILAVLMMAFSVNCHRRILCEERLISRARFGKRELKFALASAMVIVFAGAAGIPVIILVFVAGAIGVPSDLAPFLFLAYGAVVYGIFIRFLLVFPAIAVDAPGDFADHFRNSARATRGNAWRLFWASFLSGAVIGVISTAGAHVLAEQELLASLWEMVFLFVSLMAAVAIASEAFRRLAGWTLEQGSVEPVVQAGE